MQFLMQKFIKTVEKYELEILVQVMAENHLKMMSVFAAG